MEGLGPYMRRRRDELDLSLREFARRLDCSAAFISDIELVRRHPSEKVLAEIARVLKVAEDPEILLMITSDHGNIEEMINIMTGLPESQHDASPVPLYIVSQELKGKKFVDADTRAEESLGSLADVTPTLLAIMGIEKPPEMTGESLLGGLI